MSELVAMSADMFVRRRCFHTLCVATSGISQSRTRSARKGFLDVGDVHVKVNANERSSGSEERVVRNHDPYSDQQPHPFLQN
jgi:hypothetical protein